LAGVRWIWPLKLSVEIEFGAAVRSAGADVGRLPILVIAPVVVLDFQFPGDSASDLNQAASARIQSIQNHQNHEGPQSTGSVVVVSSQTGF